MLKTGWHSLSPWLFAGAFPWYSYGLFIQNFWVPIAGNYGAQWLGPTWSLAIEEQFYLLLPLLVWLVPTRKLPWVLIAGILAAPVFRLFASELSAYVLLPGRMDALLLGVLLAWLYLRGSIAPGKNNSRLVVLAAFLLLLIIYTYTAFSGAGMGDALLHSLLAIFYGCLLLVTLANTDKPFVHSLLANKPVRNVARISYSLYLWHQPANGLVHAWCRGDEPRMQYAEDVWIAVLGIALCFLLATLSYYLLERPLLRYAQKFMYS